MRFVAQVVRIDDVMVSSDFFVAVKMYRLLPWPVVAVYQHPSAEN